MARTKKRSAGDIADELRLEIISGEHRIGSQLVEETLSEIFSVSRTIIRDALHILEAEDLVQIIKNRGAFTNGFTADQVADIFTLRETLEPLATGLAILRHTDDELEALEKHLEVMSLYTSSKDLERLDSLNPQFHGLIAEATHSPLLISSLHKYHIYSRKSRHTVPTEAENLSDIYYEHAEVFEAFLERDPEAGQAAMLAHIKKATARAGF